jgi:hypothetical protein
MGTPRVPDRIKLKEKLCWRAGQYSFLQNSCCLNYPSTSLQCHSQIVCKHNPQAWYQGSVCPVGTTTTYPSARKCSIKRCQHTLLVQCGGVLSCWEVKMAAVLARVCEGRHPMWRTFHWRNMGWSPYRAQAHKKRLALDYHECVRALHVGSQYHTS